MFYWLWQGRKTGAVPAIAMFPAVAPHELLDEAEP
jgi:hypothetical protein